MNWILSLTLKICISSKNTLRSSGRGCSFYPMPGYRLTIHCATSNTKGSVPTESREEVPTVWEA